MGRTMIPRSLGGFLLGILGLSFFPLMSDVWHDTHSFLRTRNEMMRSVIHCFPYTLSSITSIGASLPLRQQNVFHRQEGSQSGDE